MNRFIVAFGMVFALSACEDSAKAIDEAKESATQLVGDMQEKVESFDMESLNLDQFGSAGEQVEALTASVQEVLNTDFSDMEAVAAVKDKLANAYSCLVASTSDVTAQGVIDKLLASIQNEQAADVIEEGVEQGEESTECSM
ncbi:hypothetical protein GT360_20610 [Vibrio astriarenae]|uniref:Lipoprotein n=1 Tax=Vibrio astriarenae TaxID=1481923 RepID=A0A7Z2T7W8_9VIBR|nr:hypothetical protein [Vibrio astriarenae]QIA65910.1 hypothetical protein GT360_20610 [Vibrio astriarenae]